MKKSVEIKNWKYGLITSEEAQSLPRGACTRNLNFLTRGSKIELRRGYNLLGTTENTGTGRITGLRTAKKPNGDDILFRTRKRKLEYFDTVTDEWIEVGSDVLPAGVTTIDSLGEDITMESYSNATGQQLWVNSPNGSLFKIMTANPASTTDMYVLGTNYKGRMRIKNGRMFVWKRNGNPPNTVDVFASKLDTKADSDYTQISAEAIGSSGSTNYTGTLAFKAGGARRICLQVTFTDTVETFTDNGDGTLTGNAGGTGTINYTSGAYNITFNAVTANTVTATYRWADDSSGGIADFAFSSTRVAKEGFILRQAGKGDMQNLASLNGKEYCMHTKGTWVVEISVDDLELSNLIFRNKVGIPNHRAMCETGSGIYYIDDTDENDPHFRILRLEYQSTEVVPDSISKQFTLNDVKVGVDLTNYRFDKGASIEFGDLILFACRTKDSTENNRVFVYNKTNKATDVLDYYVSCFEVYDGTLVAGDSVTDNVFTLFSGNDDNQSFISGVWESSIDNLDYQGMKRVVELTIEGEIGVEQSAKLSMSLDRGSYVEVKSPSDLANGVYAIQGDGDYVDRSQRVSVGAFTLGRGEVGGGGDGIEAYHYRRTFRILLDKFEVVKFKIEPQGLGYFSLSEFTFDDVRIKGKKLPNKYRVGR